MKNVEKADRVHLGSLIDSLKKGHYVIPDFQRDFEWEPWDVRELVRSIFMDYYIGTLLLWRGNKENFQTLSCEPIYGFKGGLDPQHIVLDGQQRLTAIHYAFFAPDIPFPKRSKGVIFLIDIRALLEEDYENFIRYEFLTNKNRKFLKDNKAQFESHTFPLGEMKGGNWGTSDWIKDYRDYWRDKAEDTEDEHLKTRYSDFSDGARVFRDIIEELLRDFYISYIELDHQIDVAKVCDIFTQINSKGVRLDIFDLLNAILRPKEIFLKQMWREAEEKLQFTDTKKMKTYILQVMSVLEQAYCSSKYLYYLVPGSKKTIRNPDGSKEQIILIEDIEEFNERWNQSVRALSKAIEALQNPRDFGAVKSAFVPYPSIIPAFASIKEYVAETKPTNVLNVNKKIRRWYWASIFTNRYSSSVESTTAKDFMSLKKWFQDDKAEPEMIEEFKSGFKNIDLLNENPKGSAIYNAIFNLLVINEARDWSSFELPEYSELDDHHIVPYSVFKDQGGRAINSILNRTPISDSTNRHVIRNRMPNDYIKEMLENNDEQEVYNVFQSHLISKRAIDILLREPFNKEDFEEFLEERKITIIEAIEKKLILDKLNFDKEEKEHYADIGKIEISLRKLIIEKFGNGLDAYQEKVPSVIQEIVEKQIQSKLRKKPYMSLSDYNSFESRLNETSFGGLETILLKKTNWSFFEDVFGNRQLLEQKLAQLRPFRNDIGHYTSDNIQRLEGRAAIEWFNKILK